MVGDLVHAVRLLTILPLGRAERGVGGAALFFPLAGLALGGAAAAADTALGGAAPLARAMAVVVVLAVLSAARPLAGLARLGDGVAAGRERAAVLAAMERPRPGPAGILLLLLALAAEVAFLRDAGPLRAWALLFAPMLGRWAMVVVAFSARQARAGAAGPRFEPGITFREFGWASALAGAAVLATIDAVGLLAMLAVAAVAVVLRLVAHRWLGGVNAAVFAATGAIGEIVALAVLAPIGAR